MNQNSETFKKLKEKQEEMIDFLMYLKAHQENEEIQYKRENDAKWKIPKKPK